MVSRKRERKRWRTETKLPCNTIYIACVCVCARFLRCEHERERCTRFYWNPKHSPCAEKKPSSKSGRTRHQESARSNGQSVLWKRFNEKKSRATRYFHVKVVVLHISRGKRKNIFKYNTLQFPFVFGFWGRVLTLARYKLLSKRWCGASKTRKERTKNGRRF